MGEESLAEICRGLRAWRARGRSRELAGGQEHLRRRGRRNSKGLRDRSQRSVCRLLPVALTKLKKNGRIGLFKTHKDQPDDEVTLESVCEKLVIYGTPDKVADELLSFHDEVG